MKVLITGAAGMIGRKLAEQLVATKTVGGKTIKKLRLVDVVPPTTIGDGTYPVSCEVTDLAALHAASSLISDRPDVIFHLAAIVSGHAETDFVAGYRINMDGTRDLLEAIRLTHLKEGYRPRVILASSLAVFGGDLPAVISDDFHQTPQTSYGAQKTICELLLADYSRKGFIDGYGLRLPTICIRPGLPNKAASGFFSGILREPLNGQEAILPVPTSTRHWFASPRSAVGFFLHAAGLPADATGPVRNINMPGLSATVGDAIDALARAAGNEATRLIRRQADPKIEAIIASWPMAFDTKRAIALGFTADASFDEIIRIYQEDEMSRAS